MPSAAHTLLKLIPAAITITSASRGFRSTGVSTFSIWKASFGSPKRSGRMSCAYMYFGTLADRRHLPDLVYVFSSNHRAPPEGNRLASWGRAPALTQRRGLTYHASRSAGNEKGLNILFGQCLPIRRSSDLD